MARKKRDGGGGYSWMDTYGDMVTLLLTFFIMLFSMSTVNEEKWKILVQAFSRTTGSSPTQVVIGPDTGEEGENIMPPMTGDEDLNLGDPDIINDEPLDLTELYKFLQAYVEQNNMQGSVQIEQDAASNVYISFDNNIFFDGDSAFLRRDSFHVLDFMAKCLNAVEEQVEMMRVIGHTASIPGSAINDWSLSTERASNITTYFEKAKGFPTSKMRPEGYGANYPVASNDTPEGRARNRRVQIMIVGNNYQDENMPREDLVETIKRLMSANVVPDTTAGTATSGSAQTEQGASQSTPQSTPQSTAQSTPPVSSAPAGQGTPEHTG